MQIQLEFKSTLVHLESSTELSAQDFNQFLAQEFQSKGDKHIFKGGSSKASITLPVNGSVDLHLQGGILSLNRLVGDHRLTVHEGQLISIDQEGELQVNLSQAQASFYSGRGKLSLDAHSSCIDFSSCHREIEMKLTDSELNLGLPAGTEGKIDIGGSASKIVVAPGASEDLMIDAPENDFHHFGKNCQYFIMVSGKHRAVGFSEPDSSKPQPDCENEHMHAIIRENDEIMGVFDEAESRIDQLFNESQSPKDSAEEVPGKSLPGPSDYEKYCYSLFKAGKISASELERLIAEEA